MNADSTLFGFLQPRTPSSQFDQIQQTTNWVTKGKLNKRHKKRDREHRERVQNGKRGQERSTKKKTKKVENTEKEQRKRYATNTQNPFKWVFCQGNKDQQQHHSSTVNKNANQPRCKCHTSPPPTHTLLSVLPEPPLSSTAGLKTLKPPQGDNRVQREVCSPETTSSSYFTLHKRDAEGVQWALYANTTQTHLWEKIKTER